MVWNNVSKEGSFTMVFCFTASGNSLYAARQLDDELISIASELRKPAAERHSRADAIGIVAPLY